MKKIFYTLAFITSLAVVFSACTKEEVKPQTESLGGGVSGRI